MLIRFIFSAVELNVLFSDRAINKICTMYRNFTNKVFFLLIKFDSFYSFRDRI